MKAMHMLCVVALVAWGLLPSLGQEALMPAQPKTAQLNEQGQVTVAGHSTAYLIRRLPVS